MRHHRIRALGLDVGIGPARAVRRHHPAIAPSLPARAASWPPRQTVSGWPASPIATGEGWPCLSAVLLSAVLDLATRTIVGWAMRDHMRTEPALSAPMMAPLAAAARPRSDPPLRQGQPIRSGKPMPINSARSAPCRP